MSNRRVNPSTSAERKFWRCHKFVQSTVVAGICRICGWEEDDEIHSHEEPRLGAEYAKEEKIY